MPDFPAIPKAVTRQHYAQRSTGAAKFALYALIDSVDVSLEVSADSLPAFKDNLAAWIKEGSKAFRYSTVSFWLVTASHNFRPFSLNKPPRL
jgi:hypothetical protein